LWGAVGAGILTQGPEFLQQYLQRLSGHLDEARRLLEQTPQLAPRVAELAAARDALMGASAWTKPMAFLGHPQADIAWRTFADFRPALPLTLEGLAWGLAGVVIGVAIGSLLLAPFRNSRSKVRP
jgi:hypothetical protein